MIPCRKAPLSVVILCVLALSFAWGNVSVFSAAPVAPEVEIKKHSTGKEATVRQGDKEWFIHIDVDQDRTMIIQTESDKGQEIKNQPEIIDRPMSNAEVDHVINDFVSGVQSTIKP